jgi:hypothetical protein
MAQITIDETALAQKIELLVEAAVTQRVTATTRVILGTALTEFERLYMRGETAEYLSAATFRQFLRFFEATLNARIDARIDTKLATTDEPD